MLEIPLFLYSQWQVEDKDDMSQSKNIPTAFDFFLREFKEKKKERGVIFLRGEEELLQKATSMWDDMESRQRSVYEEKAREKRKLMKADSNERISAPGKSCVQVPGKGKLPVERQVRLAQGVEGPPRLLESRATLTTYPFHVVHVNYFCELRNGTYSACEIAVAKFTFADGVKKTYHALIDPGAIPVGYTFLAELHSADTHNIPLPPNDFGGEGNYQKVLFNIKQLLMEEDGTKSKLPPLYSRPSDIDVVKTVLREFQKCVDPKVRSECVFDVRSLPKLFHDLWNASLGIAGASRFPAFGCAELELENDAHEFARGISCHFHEETDARRFCSLSCVHRWSFLIMERCCRALDIAMIPGKHRPLSCHTVGDTRSVSQLRKADTDDCDSRAPTDVSGQSLSSEKATFQNEQKRQQPKENILKPLRRPKTKSLALILMSSVNRKEDIPAFPPSHSCPDQESGSIATDIEAMMHLSIG